MLFKLYNPLNIEPIFLLSQRTSVLNSTPPYSVSNYFRHLADLLKTQSFCTQIFPFLPPSECLKIPFQYTGFFYSSHLPIYYECTDIFWQIIVTSLYYFIIIILGWLNYVWGAATSIAHLHPMVYICLRRH